MLQELREQTQLKDPITLKFDMNIHFEAVRPYGDIQMNSKQPQQSLKKILAIDGIAENGVQSRFFGSNPFCDLVKGLVVEQFQHQYVYVILICTLGYEHSETHYMSR